MADNSPQVQQPEMANNPPQAQQLQDQISTLQTKLSECEAKLATAEAEHQKEKDTASEQILKLKALCRQTISLLQNLSADENMMQQLQRILNNLR
jgi:predicted RNase H-like nuclease (RuvC/YqgF family)